MAGKWYAWSELRNGGEVKDIEIQGGKSTRTVVSKRNVTAHGEVVTRKGLGVTDEEWQALIDGGSIRNYPVPEGVDDYTSPARAFMDKIVNAQGDVDMDALMSMGLSHPPAINPPAEEQKEAEIAVGA